MRWSPPFSKILLCEIDKSKYTYRLSTINFPLLELEARRQEVCVQYHEALKNGNAARASFLRREADKIRRELKVAQYRQEITVSLNSFPQHIIEQLVRIHLLSGPALTDPLTGVDMETMAALAPERLDYQGRAILCSRPLHELLDLPPAHQLALLQEYLTALGLPLVPEGRGLVLHTRRPGALLNWPRLEVELLPGIAEPCDLEVLPGNVAIVRSTEGVYLLRNARRWLVCARTLEMPEVDQSALLEGVRHTLPEFPDPYLILG